MVSASVRAEASRILRGRAPSGDKSLLNKAINFINENPSFRASLEGAAPSGLTAERRKTFRKQEASRLGVDTGVATTAAERALQQSLPKGIRELSVEQARTLIETGRGPQSIQRRTITEQISSPAPSIERAVMVREEAPPPRSIERPARRPSREGGGPPVEGAPLVIDVLDRSTFGQERLRLGFGEAFGSFVRGTGAALGGFIRGDEDIRDPFSSFRFVGPQRGEREVFTPTFGTISDVAPEGVRRQTLFELREEAQIEAGIPLSVVGSSPETQAIVISRDIAKGVISEFQQRVDVGELSIEEATEQAQEQFQSQLGQRLQVVEQLGGEDLTIRAGETGARVFKQVAITGGILGAAALSPAIAAGLGGASIAAAGQLSVRAGREFGEREFLQSGLTLAQAGIFAGAGASFIGGSLGPSGLIPRQITQQRLLTLEAQTLRLRGAEIPFSAEESLIVSAGLRRTDVARQQLEFFIPTTQRGITEVGAEQFSIAGARGISRTQVTEFGLEGLVPKGQDIIRQVEPISFTGRGAGGLTARITRPSFDIGLGEDITGGAGVLDIVRRGRVTRTPFGGISQTQDDITRIISGTGERIRIRGIETIIEPRARGGVGAGISGVEDISLLVRPKEFGEIIKIRLRDIGAKDFGKQIFGSRGRRGDGLSFVEDRQVSQLGVSGFQAAAKISDIVKPSVDLGVRGFPSIIQIGGVGVSRFGGFQEIDRGGVGARFGTTLKPADVGGLVSIDRLETLSLGAVGVRPRGRGRQISGRGVIPKFDFAPVQELAGAQALATLQTPKLVTEQVFGKPPSGAPSIGFTPRPRAPFDPFPGRGFGGFPLGVLPSLRGERRISRGRKRKPGRISPSLTGVVSFDLGDIVGGPLPTGEGFLGVLPSQLRLVPRRKKKKKGGRK